MEAVVMLDGGEDYEEKGFEEMKMWLRVERGEKGKR
jgi:hypothetical protein